MAGPEQKPCHVVLVPFPAHGHVAPHMQLARLLHARGIHVTLVHTELHYRRLVRANNGAVATTVNIPGFGVEVIPDGLSLESPPRTLEAHLEALERNCFEPFKELLRALEDDGSRLSCVIADAPMSFASLAARELGMPDVQFFTASACGLMGYLQFEELINRGLVPLKGSSYGTDGTFDASLDWVPGMNGAMRLKDMPTFCHTTDADDALLRIHVRQMRVVATSKAVILNTFHDFEKDVVDALAASLPLVYTVGPLSSIMASLPAAPTSNNGGGFSGLTADTATSLLKEDTECIKWLDGKEARSVVYVSYGSHAAMGSEKIKEFASGLESCGYPYLWVLRPDMAADVEVIGKDGLVVPWCAQEAVLAHPAVGLFVTHCGWNSILETVMAGVPVLGWPMISEQTTNCRQVSTSWKIGAELPQEARGREIAALVREMMAGKKGLEARETTLKWKRLAEDATKEGGSSYGNLRGFVEDVLHKGF